MCLSAFSVKRDNTEVAFLRSCIINEDNLPIASISLDSASSSVNLAFIMAEVACLASALSKS